MGSRPCFHGGHYRTLKFTEHKDARTQSIGDKYSICGLIRGFEMKLQLFESQLKAGNLVHFQTLKCLQDTASLSLDDRKKYCNQISNLKNEFHVRFSDLKNLEKDSSVYASPFSVNTSEAPEYLQLGVNRTSV